MQQAKLLSKSMEHNEFINQVLRDLRLSTHNLLEKELISVTMCTSALMFSISVFCTDNTRNCDYFSKHE
jgi:hypothetical protein